MKKPNSIGKYILETSLIGVMLITVYNILYSTYLYIDLSTCKEEVLFTLLGIVAFTVVVYLYLKKKINLYFLLTVSFITVFSYIYFIINDKNSTLCNYSSCKEKNEIILWFYLLYLSTNIVFLGLTKYFFKKKDATMIFGIFFLVMVLQFLSYKDNNISKSLKSLDNCAEGILFSVNYNEDFLG